MQDHSFLKGVPEGIDFDVEFKLRGARDRITLRADGYGNLKGNYGNGAIFVFIEQLPKSLRDRVEFELNNI